MTACQQIEIVMVDGAAGRAAARPRRQCQPAIRARLEGRDLCDSHGWRIVLEEVIQKWPQHMQPEILRGVAAEADLSDGAAIEPLLMMKPGSDDQVQIGIVG